MNEKIFAKIVSLPTEEGSKKVAEDYAREKAEKQAKFDSMKAKQEKATESRQEEIPRKRVGIAGPNEPQVEKPLKSKGKNDLFSDPYFQIYCREILKKEPEEVTKTMIKKQKIKQDFDRWLVKKVMADRKSA